MASMAKPYDPISVCVYHTAPRQWNECNLLVHNCNTGSRVQLMMKHISEAHQTAHVLPTRRTIAGKGGDSSSQFVLSP